jgi:tetratricopeptide (TPR) repeat protein
MPAANICRRTKSDRTAKLLLLFVNFIIISFGSFGQQFNPQQLKLQNDAVDEFVRIKHATIDSLNKRIAKNENDAITVDCLISLYFQQMQLDHRAALRSLEQAGQLARVIHYYKGEGKYLEFLANYHMEMKNLPEAESALRQAMALYETHHYSKEYNEARQTLGLCLQWQWKFDEALKLSQQSIEYLKKVPGDKSIAYAYRRIGLILEARGKYEDAFNYFMKDKQISDTVKDQRGSRKSYGIYINFYLGKLYLEAGDHKNATHYLKVCAERAMNNIMPDVYDEEMGEIHFILNHFDSALYYFSLRKHCWDRWIKDSAILQQSNAVCNISIAKTYVSQQQYDTAITLLKASLSAFKNLIFAADIYKYLAKACLESNRFNEALDYSQQLMDIADRSGAKPAYKDAVELRWQIFDRLKKLDSAYKYLKIYKETSDVLSAEKQLRNMEAMERKSADELQHAQIDLLGKETVIHVKQKQILIITLVSFFLISLFILLSIHLKRKHEKAEFQKRAGDLKLQALRAQMNPHFIFNSLNSINSFILNNNKEDASRYLTKFSKLIRLMLHHSQSSLITLQDELDALEIYIAMEKLRFNNHFECSIYVPVEIDPSSYRVPPLIIQPFVENAIWHGLMHKKSKGSLMIEFFVINEKDVFCRITDDGVGRKKSSETQKLPGKTYKSVGMQITKDRIIRTEKSRDVSPIKIQDLVNSDGSAGGTSVTIKLPEEYD